MKTLVFICCLFLAAITAFAQKQANIWYFGSRLGLDFNQQPPQQLFNGNAVSTEGTAAIADNNGKLLFYTNGVIVVNRANNQMKNGFGLKGNVSSTSNTVIVPLPGSDSIYYLFTTGAADRADSTQQLAYNIIDLNGDFGLGEVMQKNIFVEDKCFEKIAAVKHCNKKDVWIIIHKWNSDEYHTYLLTASGINLTPVISRTGLNIVNVQRNAVGALKFSIDSKKIAAAHSYENNSIELMDFDNKTGMLSNPIVFYPNASALQTILPGVYGMEFSPGGKLLYVSTINSSAEPNILYQFDISSNNGATILASKKIISQSTAALAGALQIGPDKRIYMAKYLDTALSIITNPDVYGTGCNFIENGITFPGTVESVQFGLPTFMQSYFDLNSNPYDFTRSGNCLDLNVPFKINRLNSIDSVRWNFGDGQFSQLTQPVHNYFNPGYYDVELIVYKVDCSGLNDTINRRIWIASSDRFLGNDTGSCDILALPLGIEAIDGAKYLWSTGAVSNTITTNSSGLHWLEVAQNGCTMRDSVNLFKKPKPVVNIGQDTTVCINKQIILNAGNITAASYLWNTGETTSSITTNKTGTYSVTVIENSCFAADTVVVFPGDCDIFIPNAFTPNNDGTNDLFGVANSVTVQNFSMKIYNRYGQVIFSANNISDKWDGKYKGKAMPVGAYPWSIIYVNGKGYTKWLSGTVLILY